jgi:CRISPR-associated protein Cst1
LKEQATLGIQPANTLKARRESVMNDSGIKLTGHPFVDVGFATIAALAGKADLGDIQEQDLELAAEYVRRNYVVNPLKSFLTVVFPNSGFTQPAYEKTPENRATYAQNVLNAYSAKTPEEAEIDPFLGLPVPDVRYDVKGQLQPGRAYRQHIPLLTGEGVINFFPGGDAGLPVSGLAMLAIQAFPLGCAKCMGRLLAVHSDSPEILWHFANTFLTRNLQLVQMAQLEGSSKIPEPSRSPFTLLIEALLDADRMRREEWDEERPFSVTAYHLSNSGQAPSLGLYHLPMQVTGFLRTMQRSEYRHDWSAIVARAWQLPGRRAGDGDFEPRYNAIYEDLFRLPDVARRFIKTYLLRIPYRFVRNNQDPRADYSPNREPQLVSWKITAQFLEGVMNMDRERIDEIRKMGDRLADYVVHQNDKRLLRDLITARRYVDVRTKLIRANQVSLQAGSPPVVEFDPYIIVFEDGEELGRTDWGLARDLVVIRMIERLYQAGKISAEDLPSPEEIAPDEEGSN